MYSYCNFGRQLEVNYSITFFSEGLDNFIISPSIRNVTLFFNQFEVPNCIDILNVLLILWVPCSFNIEIYCIIYILDYH